MKTTLHYSEKMTFCVAGLGIMAQFDAGCITLEAALEYAQAIFDDKTLFNGESVEYIHIINSETGELIAECEADKEIPLNTEVWPTANEIFDDWGFNEDMGYDPYLGCYSDDC